MLWQGLRFEHGGLRTTNPFTLEAPNMRHTRIDLVVLLTLCGGAAGGNQRPGTEFPLARQLDPPPVVAVFEEDTAWNAVPASH